MKKEFKDYDDDTIFVLDEEEDILTEEQGDEE
ncbi:unknown [Firmicutes bacterium CAG:534]|nr:unknown [Firmicutes bacterium CAG:534]